VDQPVVRDRHSRNSKVRFSACEHGGTLI
jgi:hypothetical protein